MSTLVFMDTETTGLSLDDDIWEFAAVRRDSNGEQELHLFIEHDPAKCARLPDSFRADHAARFPSECSGNVVSRKDACLAIADLFREGRPHVVGAVPNFDTERITRMVRQEWPHWPENTPGWHYHLIDVENLAVGYLFGRHFTAPAVKVFNVPDPVIALPWDSNRLSEQVGVTPPTTERHTAMGDVRWCMALYDAITRNPEASA